MNHQNVVVIILESFSKEHFGSLNHTIENGRYKGFTPFLDSLLSHSLVTDGYSDGKRSIEGIPAILASLPTWMTQDYITSVYGGNTINSIASLLKTEGYGTAFFHGGNNGTMGFDAFCGSAGFDKYYGRNEYANDKDYDGEWGIWDEPFLQYMANKLNTMQQPFLASVFTLSSHHPYQVPEKYKGKFREGKLPIQQTVMYSDYALKRFFETAAHMPWFDNTLFVITADHTSESALPFYQNRVGQYSIPVIFYKHDTTLSLHKPVTAQQTDIMPSVLHYLGYTKPFVAFGNSVFDTTAVHAAVSNINGSYQLIQNGWALEWNSNDRAQLYHFVQDSALAENLAVKQPQKLLEMENLLKAYIQQYNNRMIDNRLIIK
jgi:phosphoglycerol transferase MdoB-like AlkP superfamily enzyme